MLKQTKIILAISVLASSQAILSCSTSEATPDSSAVSIQDIGYAGNGCPAGSATVLLADDRQSVSVLIDEYIVEAGGTDQRTFDRKKCDIAFGLKVPSGVSVSLLNAEYHGFIDLPEGAEATLSRDYFFAGNQGPELTTNWNGSVNKGFEIKDSVDIWSACGADVVLRAKNAGTVRTNAGEPALLTISTNIKLQEKTKMRYNLAYRSC